MMLKNRGFARFVGSVAVAAFTLAANQAPAAAAGGEEASVDKQRKLIRLLQSDAPPQDKAITCKQLAIYGTEEAVPALALLLSDESLASWARIALEVIPGPAADESLRQAMDKLQGALLIGVINSIASRRDAKAIPGLLEKLENADADVASAAAVALGRLGGTQAAKALEQALASAPAAVRPAVAEGCILCAEKSLAEGKPAEAVKLYDAVRQANVPKQRQLEAVRGAILARRSAGIPLLIEQLRSADKALFGIGLRTARELSGREVTEALAAELDRANPDRQFFLLLAIADRRDGAVLPAVLKMASGGPKRARIAAVGLLERLGSISCMPVMLDAAADDDAELAKTAKAVLTRLPYKEVDADLLARLPQATGLFLLS
jgi:HEAT repeat protein